MAEIIRMPKMSDTMTEGVIASWLVNVGDKVKSGDILAEVETDKATMELENYTDGYLLHIGIHAKQSVVVDGVIAIIGEKDEDISALLQNLNPNTPKVTENKVENTPTSPTKTTATPQVNATVVRMPKMSDTMTEGILSKWLVQVGDKVKSGDILAEVETDKATMELENYEEGTILYLGVEQGKGVPVDGIIAIIGEQGTDYQSLLSPTQAQAPAIPQPQASSTPTPSPQPTSTPKALPTTDNGRLKASPLAKKLAAEKGYNLQMIKGSGENGRIIKKDIENFVPAPATPTASTSLPTTQGESFTEIPVSQMRKTIAKRLSESKFTAPHFYLTMEINMDKAAQARKSMNEYSAVKISFNDMVVKAAAVALKKHPAINSSWLGDKIRQNHHVHIGVAVAVEEGLLVPVIRFTDTKTLSQIASETKDLAQKAKNKKLQPADWAGNTFSISNLGMFGIEEFTAIVNPPDACILAVGAIKECPIVRDGQLVIGSVMKVTLSCDHRIVDGASGAAFLQTLKNLLEEPVRLLV